MAELCLRGLFWWYETTLPDHVIAPSSSVAGELRVSDEGRIQLTLDGYLERGKGHGPWAIIPSAAQTEDLKSRTIEGRLIRENKQVFLSGLSSGSGTTLQTAGISTESFLAERCCISNDWGVRWFPQTISSLTIDLSNQLAWVRFNPFKIDPKKRSIGLNSFDARAYDTKLGRVTVDGWSCSTNPMTFDQSGRFYSGAEMKIDFSSACSPSSIEQLFRSLQELFIILTDSEQCLPFPSAHFINGEKTGIFKYYFPRIYKEAPSLDLFALPTNLTTLKDTLGSIMDTWLDKRERFGPGYYLYLGTRRGLSLYTENHYWSLITGIESFHSTKFPVRENTKLRAKIDRIVSRIEKGRDKKWLKQLLDRELAPKLNERVCDVLRLTCIDLDPDGVKRFAQSCADRRNDLAHFGSNRGSMAYSTFIENVSEKINALRVIYHVILLQEINIPKEMIRNWFYNAPGSFRHKAALTKVGLLRQDN